MKRIAFLLLISLLFTGLAAQDGAPFLIYNAKGKKVSYRKMLKTITKGDILLFGEQHNNPIAHWLQLEVSKDLAANRTITIGMEMIERDEQKDFERYLNKSIDQKKLDSLIGLWPNFATDYAPVVDFAREAGIDVVGTNVPRRFASQVYRGEGLEELNKLTDEEKTWVAPLPIPFDASLPRYVNMLEMMGGHGGPTIVQAQAIKDATMGHFVLENMKEGGLFVHLNGAYHSDYYEGIYWYLQQYADASKEYEIITISTVEQANIGKLENEYLGSADFIICVDEDMTKTY